MSNKPIIKAISFADDRFPRPGISFVRYKVK